MLQANQVENIEWIDREIAKNERQMQAILTVVNR